MSVYRLLLRFYPARFREEYESQMERQLWDEYRETRSVVEHIHLVWRTLVDLSTTIPAQRFGELRSDWRHAVRSYRSRKLVFVLAVSALALAIGAATGIFSVLNSLLLRNLPFKDAGALVELWLSPFNAMQGRKAFQAWAKEERYLRDEATFCSSQMDVSQGTGTLRVTGTETSANLFSVLGVVPRIGRNFEAGEDVPGRNTVAIISYGLWQQWYAGDASALGTHVRLNGKPFTVIGVAPTSFDYPGGGTDIWVPTVFDIETIPKRGAFLFRTIGRLRAGMSLAKARPIFEAEIRRHAPSKNLPTNGESRPQLMAVREQLAGPLRGASWALAGMALLLVLAACANVAHLLLAQVAEKRAELALRAALGASRGRLLQQLVTEATTLTALAAGLGVFIAAIVAQVANSYLPPALASQRYAVLDGRVLLFATALALLTGGLLGALPVLGVGSSSCDALRTQGATRAAPGRLFRSSLTGVQTGLACILLFGAVALGGAFLRLTRADLGFRTTNVVTASISTAGAHLPNQVAEWQRYKAALQRLRSLEGVQSAGAVGHLPLGDDLYMQFNFKLDAGKDVGHAIVNACMPGYFRALGTRMIAGRDFTMDEQLDREKPVIVSEQYASQTGLGSAVLGRHLLAPWSRIPYLVVGIVADQKLFFPMQSESEPQIFWSVQEEPPPALTFVARVSGVSGQYVPRVRDALRSLDRHIAVYDVKTYEDRVAENMRKPSFYTKGVVFLAFLGTLLASVGIYGSSLYSVAQRTHEIGVRMALGAPPGKLRAALLRESLLPVFVGLSCGVPVAVAGTRLLMHYVFDTQQLPLQAMLLACGLLLAVGASAAWRAGAQVLLVDPLVALRAE